MNSLVALKGDMILCGSVRGHDCICLRPSNHFGSHVFKDKTGKHYLLQTGFGEISFEIARPIAEKAIMDKYWTWSE